MLKIAITGNIASGKTTVENILKSKGYKVFDTDLIAHRILEDSQEVKANFNTTERKEIAKIVFSDSDKLKLLESIIHPKVKKELEEIFSQNDDDIIFVSVPQLFESGFDSMFDKIIYITADESIREERLIKRNSYTLKEAQRRINAQNDYGKQEKSDFIIKNNNSFDELVIKVETLLQDLN